MARYRFFVAVVVFWGERFGNLIYTTVKLKRCGGGDDETRGGPANLHRVRENEDDSEWDGESTKKNERHCIYRVGKSRDSYV